jgi:hypothetical protein
VIHWKPEEAGPRVDLLRRAGFEAECLAPQGAAGLRTFRERPPDAFVIDLERLPSHGRAVGIELRRQKGTRAVPLVFAGGDPDKIARTRQVLPDAAYAVWDAVAEALAKALRAAPSSPVAPSTMAIYAGRPLAAKLGIKAGGTVALAGAPDGFATKLGPLPDGARIVARAAGVDRILLFARSRSELEKRFPAAARALALGGGLWIVWPKKASGIATDLSEAAVREFGLGEGWVDYKICAVDETWSGLQFARRAPVKK